MHRAIMMCAVCLVASATDVAAQCPFVPDLTGQWGYSALGVRAEGGFPSIVIAHDCVFGITGQTISTVTLFSGEPSANLDCANFLFQTITVFSDCSFTTTTSGCVYRGHFNGSTPTVGAGVGYCNAQDRITFDLIKN
jgi:hypothetical protein